MRGEARGILPAWLYLLLTFSLLRLTQSVILREAGVGVMPPSRVLVGTLIVAKALLTVDKLRLFARLRRRPVAVVAAVKTLAYVAVALLFQYFDGLFEFRHHPLHEATAMVVQRFSTARFWMIQTWLVVLLGVLSVTRELVRRIGRKRFRRIFLGH
jgi:hypothetical protein